MAMASRFRNSSFAGLKLGETLEFMRLLWRIEHGLQSTSKRMESSLGITGPQRLMLRIIHRFPAVSAGQLSAVVRLHPSTVTGILQRLETKRLIVRMRDPADSRRVRLTVTPAALPYINVQGRTVESAVRQALRTQRASSVRATRATLHAIAAALEETSSLGPSTSF